MRRPCVTRIRQPPGVRVGEGGGAVSVRRESEAVCCGCEDGGLCYKCKEGECGGRVEECAVGGCAVQGMWQCV